MNRLIIFALALQVGAGCATKLQFPFGKAQSGPKHRPAAAAAATAVATRPVPPAAATDIKAPPSPEVYRALAAEVEQALGKHVIGAFFPRAVDRDSGGFHPAFSRDWKKQPAGNRSIVFQSRMTWIAARVAARQPELREEFLDYATHGLRYLDQVMWDREHGGFFWAVDERGRPTEQFGTEKHLYGEAFGMYAAAAVYRATGDQQALDLAMRTFKWLAQHAHDAKNGGYIECLVREGAEARAKEPLTPANARTKAGGFFYGTKSMNAHIHMLEALAELYSAAKDPAVAAHLDEMLGIVRDRIAVWPGCLNLYFTPDWRALPDHDSFGHDVETAFLLLEAAEALGKPDDAATLRMARMLVDHALDWGWDDARGGFYDKGYALAPAFDTRKVWWVQVEGLNALLLMHERFGAETDRYWRAFLKQWDFIRRYMLDAEYAGLFEETDAAGKPLRMAKSHNWKAAYHDGRSFMLVADRLNRLAGRRRD